MLDDLAQKFYFNWYALPVVLVAGLIPLTGFYIYLQNKKSITNLSFFLLCLAILCWLLGQTGVYMTKDPDLARLLYRRVAFSGVVLISPTVYFFSAVWLKLYERKKLIVWSGLLGAAFFYVLGLFSDASFPGVRQYYWGYYPIYGVNNMVFLVFFFSYFFAAFYNFAKALRRETEKIRRIQIKYILIAFGISFLSSLDYLPKLIYFPLYPLGFLYVFIWITLVAYAIIRYKAMDIETVIHKTLMWFFSTVTAITPFAVIVYYAQTWLRGVPQQFATAVYLLIILGFYSYFRAVKPRLDAFFQRRMTNLNAVSNRFSSELVYLKDLRDLLQTTSRMLRRTLFAKNLSIYLRNNDQTQILPAIVKRMRGVKGIETGHPFLKWLEKYNGVFVAEFAENNPEYEDIKAHMLDYLSKTQASVVLPLILGEATVGVIHLGGKENLKQYTSEEVAFLAQVKASLTIAFSNSLQYIEMQESLQRWNDELEKKVEERTEQLQQTQNQLVQAEKLATIGTLAGGMAHEINNPLTAVLTNAQILKMTAQAEDLESISLIEEGAKRCQIIIQKLMKYARKPMGQQETLGKVDINKVVDSAVAFLKYQLEQENIRIEVDKLEEVPLIEGNANEIEQVLTNLILNAKDAIRFVGRQGVVKISTFKENDLICISVEDNGIGISKENLQKVFDPFFTTKEIGEGTGLGLAVSFGIIQRHDGEISVESVLNRGAKFNISFNASKIMKGYNE